MAVGEVREEERGIICDKNSVTRYGMSFEIEPYEAQAFPPNVRAHTQLRYPVICNILYMDFSVKSLMRSLLVHTALSRLTPHTTLRTGSLSYQALRFSKHRLYRLRKSSFGNLIAIYSKAKTNVKKTK